MNISKKLLLLAVILSISGCATPVRGYVDDSTATPPPPLVLTETPDVAAVTIPDTPTPLADVPVIAPTPTPTLDPTAWKNFPVVPVVSARMVDVYRAGLAAGRDPTRFSKIGDCQNITTYFLAAFDNPRLYRLGPQYAYLQGTIDQFSGSWSRESEAVAGGMNVAAVQNSTWLVKARPDVCKDGESPLVCEIRLNNPSIVVISMEESWSGDIVKYNMYLRKIVQYVLSQNIVPILATRAELPGSSEDINATVARIAYDYQVPLWNFWAATNPLPFHGLTGDGFHLTQAQNLFDDPTSMEEGWPWRNLTALQAIDAVYRAVDKQP